MKFRLAGTGCCLLDIIHNRMDFGSPQMARYRSRSPGDGGLEPGKLVFNEDFERFAGQECLPALVELTGGREPDARNIGGPGVVALIHAAQLLDPELFDVQFTGTLGHDAVAGEMERLLGRTPLSTWDFLSLPGVTPFTYVLSDPSFDGGRGERSFLNNIGTAGQLRPQHLPASLLTADLVVFGGTGLVPQIHDALDELLPRARANGAFTVVNTVYDFRHQRQDPTGRWPLGNSDRSYAATDLLVCDHEEALRLAGASSIPEALDFFMAKGVGAAVVTNGARDIEVAVGSPRYGGPKRWLQPASRALVDELAQHPERKGDTTGAGDNFAGGVIVSVAEQLQKGRGGADPGTIDLDEAVAWGAVSGGCACFHLGGVDYESHRGEKRARLEPYLQAYRQDRKRG
ncbi:MAG: carbohydrate kinase family protein [Spirochaetales bacterium]